MQINKLLSMVIAVVGIFSNSYSMTGISDQIIITGMMTKKSDSFWYTDRLQYTPGQNPAGIVINYPQDFFTTAPYLIFSIEKDGFTPGNSIASGILSWNSTTSAGIVIVVDTNGTVTEADDTYYVTFRATGT